MIVRVCSSKGAYEALPEKRIRLRLVDYLTDLKKAGCDILVETPYILIVKLDGIETTILSSGRLLMKDIKSKKLAEEIARKLYKILGIE